MKNYRNILFIFIIIIMFFTAVNCGSDTNNNTIRNYNTSNINKNNTSENNTKNKSTYTKYKVNVIREIDRDHERMFTQGFEIHKGIIYEGTGLFDETSLKKIDINTGEIIRQVKSEEINPNDIYFGEGITIWDDKLIQLSWKKGKAYTFNLKLEKLDAEFLYDTEGWGLTHNDKHLIMSDGSKYLFFRKPNTFEIVRKMYVGVSDMNELEYVDGIIYANIWKKDIIIMIDEESGKVTGIIYADDLLCCRLSEKDPNAVLNGIAYNPASETFYLTGKECPKIYEVTFETME